VDGVGLRTGPDAFAGAGAAAGAHRRGRRRRWAPHQVAGRTDHGPTSTIMSPPAPQTVGPIGRYGKSVCRLCRSAA
jgi:hypothetical protein